ncbi:MAG TPA: PilT/PilU family type 4a pilus ATPase [Thiobacillaceae bacterium]|nr:PilT/PilU family type 4a pilus ATPase [Thiobacillaceae bacterium]HNU62903.1 PilT/PilU family type 4a pilus ATPase [Thiobacillaceae bacterium]
MANIVQLLHSMVQKKASDLYITAGARISLKIEGRVLPTSLPELTAETAKELAYALMSPGQIQSFEASKEMNFGYGIAGVGRFRVNVFQQRGAVAMVVRHLPTVVPTLPELGLPAVLDRLALERRGLVLVVGAAGAGKTSTMAAMLERRNQSMEGHILTVEDPIEYVYRHRKALVNQREVGTDTASFEVALLNALRESPDMIMVGEIRDRSAMEQVISYANTGHFCLSTLHAINSYQALTRIISFFPLETRNAVLYDLASCLVGIIAQRLVPTKEGVRVPVVEVFVVNYHIRELIREGRMAEIREVIEKGHTDELQSFDYALIQLYRAGRIDFEEARAYSDSPRQLHLLACGADAESQTDLTDMPALGLPASLIPDLPGSDRG